MNGITAMTLGRVKKATSLKLQKKEQGCFS